MPGRDKLSEFVAWCGKHITGDEKGQAQIFISIDDNEEHRPREIVDEIFGVDNFVCTVVWQKSYTANQTAQHISATWVESFPSR